MTGDLDLFEDSGFVTVLKIIRRGYALEFQRSTLCLVTKLPRDSEGQGLTITDQEDGGSRGIDTSPSSGTGGQFLFARVCDKKSHLEN